MSKEDLLQELPANAGATFNVKYGAGHVIQIFVPVALCMTFVAIVMNTVTHYRVQNMFLPYTPFHTETDEVKVIVYENVLNTLIILSVVVMMTCCLVALYKFRFYRVIYAWVVGAGFVILFFLLFTFIKREVVKEYSLDYYFFFEILAAVTYAMANASKAGIAKKRSSKSSEANATPSSKSVATGNGKDENLQSQDLPSTSSEERKAKKKKKIIAEAAAAAEEEEFEDDGIKLGLGDFIFYSLLVGKSCEHDDNLTVVACIICILIGLSLTLVILAIRRHALPALPISIFFGVIANFCTAYMISPMATALATRQLFV